MLDYKDYQFINEIREKNTDIYELICKISDFSLQSASLGCHDLRNHAALISSYCQLLSMTEPVLAQNPYFQKIELNIHNLLSLFDEIGEFRYSFKNDEMSDTNLKELLYDAVTRLRKDFPGIYININFNSTIPSDKYNIVCRTSQMLSALNAILINSVESCSTDSIQIEFKINIVDNFLELIISDNGCGFSSEMLENALYPFTTEKKNHSGLGLAIASTVIYRHNGNLKISNTDSGSQVTILLPVKNYFSN